MGLRSNDSSQSLAAGPLNREEIPQSSLVSLDVLHYHTLQTLHKPKNGPGHEEKMEWHNLFEKEREVKFIETKLG